ncbi:hypothetical protein LINPERHAP1_LOCUS38903 [Linum perenne]
MISSWFFPFASLFKFELVHIPCSCGCLGSRRVVVVGRLGGVG